MAIPRSLTQRNWRRDGACLSRGFVITLAPAPRRKNTSLAFALGATFASSGDHPDWWNGSKKNDTSLHFSLDLLSVKQDNRRHGSQEKPERTSARQTWRKGAGEELVRCANRQDRKQRGQGKGCEAQACPTSADREVSCCGPREQEKGEKLMRNRKQHGQIIRIGDRWYVRYWERRNSGGNIERKRVTHQLGPVTTRGKRPPADIESEVERHMATINSGAIPAERIVTIGDFVEGVYLPWIEQHKRPSTAKGYRDIWEDHLKPLCEQVWLRDTRTFHVQGWLNQIGQGTLSRNTLKHVKSVVSGIFTLAKQQDYFQGGEPCPRHGDQSWGR